MRSLSRFDWKVFLRVSAALGVLATGTVSFSQQAAVEAPQLRLDIPHSNDPFTTYLPTHVPEPDLANSPRIDGLIQDGKLYLSLHDAIVLALENNLDIAIARFNIPIAETDIERTKAGGFFRGVDTGVVQNTPGAGVGGVGTGAAGAGAGGGAGGTSSGAGGAGAGSSGLVQSTLGTGTIVNSYDPLITGTFSLEHYTQPLSDLQLYGVPSFQLNTFIGNVKYTQSLPTGATVDFRFYNNRSATNSIFTSLSPQLGSYYNFEIIQPLLAGFGFLPNLRYLLIAKNNRKITDASFKDQIITSISQIGNMYWDLVNAYDDEQVKERSLDFAQQTFESDKKQLELQAIPQMDVLKAEGEVAQRKQDMTIAKTTLLFQELLLKNALTKNLDDPMLAAMPIMPTTSMRLQDDAAEPPLQQMVAEAMQNRPELYESALDLENRKITRKSAENALLPSLALEGYYGGTGLSGQLNPAFEGTNASTVPKDWPGAVSRAFNNSSPDYLVGLQLQIPLRNRVAKADQYRSELEYRQAELRAQQLKKQIQIEVTNAAYALEQKRARVEAAGQSRDLAEKTFEITQQEQKLGAGSSYQTLSAQHDLSVAESALVAAETDYEKSRVELNRVIGATLDLNHISIADARTGVVRQP